MATSRTKYDPYQPLESPHAPGLADRLRKLGVLDDLDLGSAAWVASVIIAAVMDCGLTDSSAANALQQKAANVACGSDGLQWHNAAAVSNAFAAAADALQPQAQAATGTADRPKKTPSRTRAAPK
jgi:hypothetical protein